MGPDGIDMIHTAIMQALGLVRMAHTSIDAMRFGPWQQQGEMLIRNRGGVEGCAIHQVHHGGAKSAHRGRALLPAVTSSRWRNRNSTASACRPTPAAWR